MILAESASKVQFPTQRREVGERATTGAADHPPYFTTILRSVVAFRIVFGAPPKAFSR